MANNKKSQKYVPDDVLPYTDIQERDFVLHDGNGYPVYVVEHIDGDAAWCTDGDGDEKCFPLWELEKA